MSVLIFADNHNGKFPKSSFEAVSYGADVAAMLGTEAIAITCGTINGDGGLGNAGANKVLHAAGVNTSDSQQMTRLIVAAAQQTRY
jgi:electron transfer flavoprotein alpha subunit